MPAAHIGESALDATQRSAGGAGVGSCGLVGSSGVGLLGILRASSWAGVGHAAGVEALRCTRRSVRRAAHLLGIALRSLRRQIASGLLGRGAHPGAVV